ncbi:MAG: serine--tRNA ligase [Actinomycetota bacterium]
MIDLRLLRSEPEVFTDAFRRRGASVDVQELLGRESAHRELIARVEAGRADHNRANKKISRVSAGERPAAIAEAKMIADGVAALEEDLKQRRRELDETLAGVPNLVHPDAPEGRGDEANRLVKQTGERPDAGFEARDHLDIGEALGIIDVERAAKVSGSRFAFLRGDGAMLEFALVRFAIDRLRGEGFIPIITPVLVRREAMYGTGFFPTDEAQVYKTESDDLYLAGTAEVPVAAMHAKEIFDEASLPVRYAGFSTCFRREAGTYGKDTRGIIRVHQFDKVEMFSFCHPDASDEEHLWLLAQEEAIFEALEIPFRVVEICAGDLADPNYRKFDIEAWLPGSNRWLEVTSCSNDIDYQARRLQVRFKGEKGNEPVHTLNGTAVAIQRALVALLENHQQADGSVKIPPALAAYTGFAEIPS